MVNWASSKGLLSIAGTALMLVLGIGIGVGYILFQPSSSEASSRLETNQERVTRLEASIVDKDVRFTDLLNQVASFKEEIARTQATNAALRDQIDQQQSTVDAAELADKEAQGALRTAEEQVASLNDQIAAMVSVEGHLTNLQSAIGAMSSDRLLLVELRKRMPDNLEDAEKYWKGVKEQAVQSDPSLGTKVDRVIRLLPTYFDWIDGTYTDTCDSVLSFFDTGAVEFGTMSGDLQNDVFLVLINRIDSAINLAEN